LLNMDGMNEGLAKALASNGVRSMEDLAECATDELMDLIDIEEQDAQTLIMTARAPWFE
jgi:N utilization substance protein A